MSAPNILCISVDSLRADFCSFLNQSLTTTPFLESLADESTLYHNTVSPSTWTLPVHASVFTGLYPEEHQINDEGVQLGDHPTFAELLGQRGYSVRSFGHNGWLEQGDILRGFDHVHTPKYGPISKGLTGLVRRGWRKLHEATFRVENEDRFTIDRVIESLSKQSEPFCYFVHLQGVHYPYHPHITAYRRFGDFTTHGLYRIHQTQRELYDSRLNRFLGLSPISDADIEHFKDLYRGCIYEADQLIGEVVETLQEDSLLDDTLLVVFGDHGDSFGTDGIFGHNFTVTDGVVRVPLLVRDPSGELTNEDRNEIVQLNDLYPTVLDAAGCDPPDTRSQSLYSDMTRDSAFVYYSAPESMWTDMCESLPPDFEGRLDDRLEREQHLVWKEEDRKLVWYPRSDRYESIGPRPEELRKELSRHKNALRPVSPGEQRAVSEEVLENIKEMGYL
ncbi:sulfatase [Halosimplex halobium]|uniref:sulfatase n=1 Tax=Halosimplex halobium TaxID=3396618 RepID=UPI003F564B08